jgi:hypothetical protein
MPRKSPFIIALSCTEERILVERSRQYTASYCRVVRAKIILLGVPRFLVRDKGNKIGQMTT